MASRIAHSLSNKVQANRVGSVKAMGCLPNRCASDGNGPIALVALVPKLRFGNARPRNSVSRPPAVESLPGGGAPKRSFGEVRSQTEFGNEGARGRETG